MLVPDFDNRIILIRHLRVVEEALDLDKDDTVAADVGHTDLRVEDTFFEGSNLLAEFVGEGVGVFGGAGEPLGESAGLAGDDALVLVEILEREVVEEEAVVGHSRTTAERGGEKDSERIVDGLFEVRLAYEAVSR